MPKRENSPSSLYLRGSAGSFGAPYFAGSQFTQLGKAGQGRMSSVSCSAALFVQVSPVTPVASERRAADREVEASTSPYPFGHPL